MKLNRRLLLAVSTLFWSCQQKVDQDTLFRLMENTGIDFRNDVKDSPDFNIFTYRNFYNGGGVAIGDINNDGLGDVFMTSNSGPNKLYLNKGNWQFEDISDKAGFGNKKKWSTGVVMADVNHDGWLDIYVCNAGYQKGVGQEDELFINNHQLGFADSAAAYGIVENDYTTHVSFFDYDLDGDLDLYILNNSFIPVNTLNYANNRDMRAKDWPVADFLKGGGDKLLRNDNGRFTDVSADAGIFGSLIGFGLGVTVGDVNNDHYPDIYISNDFFERDYLYINQRNGKFKEELENWMQHISLSSMGADMADINNDGYPDIFTTDMLPDDEYRLKTTASFESIDVNRLTVKKGFYHQYMQNALQVNNKNGRFLETAHYSGVAASDWSWGALIFDADNDGLSDIYVCNGIYRDVTDQDFIDFFANEIVRKMALTGKKEQIDQIISKMPSRPILNKAYRNTGNLRFEDAGIDWGITQPSFSNGAAYGDLDNDGDLDMIVNNVNEKAFIYRNNSRELKGSHYIGVSLKGRDANTFAVGSTIKVYQGDQVMTREVIPARGFQSSIDYKAIIGLGDRPVDSMTIIWPDRTYTLIPHPARDSVYVIQQPATGKIAPELTPAPVQPLMDTVSTIFDKHREDDYVDFYYERNVPMMLSREGPKAATGDVNGDGLIDIYIGGAANQGGQLYLQTEKGFVKKEGGDFRLVADFEDVATLLFDCDKDGDLDLFVGSGGNSAQPGSREMQNRLYLNDGKGNFQITSGALPPNIGNTAVVINYDIDNDGDQDLFVGSRCIPGNYGTLPFSYLLLNDGHGKFTDIAPSKNPEIAKVGLVTGAVFANTTGDAKPELIIAGEWMAPRIFTWTGDRYAPVKSNLDTLEGCWQSLAATDIDNDGDQDLILGNMGENFYLHPQPGAPQKIWINDFDGNGITDKIITRTAGSKDVTVFMKRDLTDQLPSLKKLTLKHEDYAKKTIQDLFPSDQLQKSLVKTISYAPSCIAINEGNGKFSIRRLPVNTQLSCINTILCTDINKDGKTDLVMGGNCFAFLPQFARMDASFGHVLLNKGNGEFTELSSRQSGLDLSGVIRDIREIPAKDGRYLIVLQNDEKPVLLKMRQ
ncbi:VCBS repeat-containing protein [Paraflavitalea sp. CAU 1676]|uniref:VCBS repeat-containing protein n=1 Tax=Paraflavitalea sp. CAU 1676 TaxID=3032598 RepID=UPI0023DC4054|nr:VCBS repeat-containing protein [Paraflavitalea sp. CAU 1676]MDF2186920.1 VCBS repeat-containing protein [Paraflavitalea sp. CAU 1676]